MRMLNLVGVEMRRALHRRLVWWMVALACVGCVIVGLIAFNSSRDVTNVVDDHPALMANWWVAGSGDGTLTLAAVFLALGAAICGASVAGAEWRAGTITTVLGWESSRLRLHLARSLSAFILAFVISALLQGFFLLALVPAVAANGNTIGTDGDFWASLLYAVVRISFVTGLVAILALSIATIGRNTVAALVAISAWAMIGENLVRANQPGLARWLITENVAIVVPWTPMTDVEFHRGPGVALATLLVYLLAAVLVALATFMVRDIAGSS